MIKIFNNTFENNAKSSFVFNIVDNYEIPITVIAGNQDGPTILFSAGIHSGEYPGIPATIQFANRLNAQMVKGNIIFVHCVNTSGFFARTDAFLPEDTGNLNACYPGKIDGTISQKIAYYFSNEVFPKVDYLFDLHSGGQSEALTPCLFYPGNLTCKQESLNLAKQLEFPYAVVSNSQIGHFGYFVNCLNKPGLLLERGYGGLCLEDWVSKYIDDMQRLLAYLGVIDYQYTICSQQTVFSKANYITCKLDGLWHPLIETNQHIYQNDLLGYITNWNGDIIEKVYSEHVGVILYYTSMLAIRKNNPLVAYGCL